MNLYISSRNRSVTDNSIPARRRASIRHHLLRASVIAVVGCVAAFASVAAAPGISAAPVACNAASLVSALAAVSGSGQSGTVTLTASCTYTMTAVNNTVDGENAFPDILGSVTVVGNGATITRSTSAPDFRFFMVDDGGSLDLSNVTLSNGSIPSGDIHGGGAILSRSVLTVTAVSFLNNQSMGTTGGGAIDNHDTGQLTITRSTFTGNSALQGGAIEDEATLCHTTTPVCGQGTITDSTFTNNSSSVNGGGAFESQLDGPNPALICTPPWPQAASCQEAGGAHDTLIRDTFSGNMAMTEGGAIANFGTTTVSNSTIYNNGITGTSTAGDGGGGGIQNTGSISVIQSTLAANESQFGANVHDFNDTVHQTSPPTTALGMSIVTGGVTGVNCSGSIAVVDNGYNLDSGTSCGFTNNALNSTAPKLGALASNGGITQTMALLSGSPAVDAIPAAVSGCAGSTDQRGVNRPQNSNCDIGAFEVDTTAPTVPAGLAATATKTPQVNLSWNASTDNLGVAGYTIYRNGSTLTTVSGTTLSYSDLAVTQTTTYTYKVDAFDAAGNHSAKSASVSATTPDITAPSVPAGLSAAATTTPQVNLSWSASTDNVGVTGYTIYRNGSTLTTVSGATLTYSDLAVTQTTTYTYRVDAFDAAGNHSAQSASASATTPDITAPSVPTGLAATTTKTPQVNLSWSASTDNVAVTGYDVYRDGSKLATVGGSTLTYTDLAVSGMTTYTYRVDAFDAAGNHSAQSASVSANAGDITPPSVPAGLSASGTSVPSVILTWNASTDDVGVAGYTIYRNGAMLTTVDGTTLTFTDTTVVGSTPYSYTVDAFDAAANHSAQSTAATTSTLEVMNAFGGGLSSAPDAVAVGSNQTAVFVRGSDNALWYRMRTGSTWTAWQYLGGVLSSAPSAVSWGPNRIDVFVRGGDNALWSRTWNGTTWSGWQSLGGIITSAPDAASWGVGNLEVFGRGGDGSLWLRSWNGTSWNGWQPLGGILKGEASAVSTASNQMDVFVRGGDNGLWERSWNGTNWTAWQAHGGVISADPNAVSTGSGSLDVFVRGGDNALWLRAWNGTSWSWQYLGGTLKSAPEAVSCTAGHADVFIIGADNGLWQLGFDGTSWHGFRPLGGQWSYGPSAICESGQADIFVRSIGDGLWETTNPAS